MYEIFYENICGEMISTGISVENQNAPEKKQEEIEVDDDISFSL